MVSDSASKLSPVSIMAATSKRIDCNAQSFTARLSEAKSFKDPREKTRALVTLAKEMIDGKADQKLIVKVLEQALESVLNVEGDEGVGRHSYGDAKVYWLIRIFVCVESLMQKLNNNTFELLCKKGFKVVGTMGTDDRRGYADDKMEGLLNGILFIFSDFPSISPKIMQKNNLIGLFNEAIVIAKTLEGYTHRYGDYHSQKIDCMKMSCRYIALTMAKQGFNEREIMQSFKNKGIDIELKNTKLISNFMNSLDVIYTKELENLTIKMNTDPAHIESLKDARIRRYVEGLHLPKEKENEVIEKVKEEQANY